MQDYKNIGGNSNVIGYVLDVDSIVVYFRNGKGYLYTNSSAGASNVEHMKSLAKLGRGLNSFINTTVKKRYASILN